ncbi:MAG: DNA methyltransferase [Candidatus Latescibacterota bacterium]
MRATSFVAGADGLPPIAVVEQESRRHAERVPDDLRHAVYGAAESVAQGLLSDAVARGTLARALDLGPSDLCRLRDAALTAIYRILFVLYAEARDPRLDEHALYRTSYSAHGLLDELGRDPCRAWPEGRCCLWQRLQALFRIYDEGLPPVAPWHNIPPRGGDFFSRTTPAGRVLAEARLGDGTVVALMRSLATAAPRSGVGRERLSFRELDIESLGSVYEGLLEHEPRLTAAMQVEVRVQGRTYVLGPPELVELCARRGLELRGDPGIVQGAVAEGLCLGAGRGESAGEVDAEPAGDAHGVRRGAAARLVRRLEPGTFHFVPGPGRKGSGSFYTPRPLVQDIVHHALTPLVEGRSAAELESLRILDPACGSGHFLVAAMRLLGQALHRAYCQEHPSASPPEFASTTGQGWDDDWRASDEAARAANSEARAWCKRRVAERCLFGVDLNPTAVELAGVALWIESVAGDRPLTYFEHHVRCGNSLLGTWLDRLGEPPLAGMAPAARRAAHTSDLFAELVRQRVAEAARLRHLIDHADVDSLRQEDIDPESPREQAYKDRLRRQAEETLDAARRLGRAALELARARGHLQRLRGPRPVDPPAHRAAPRAAARPGPRAR